MFMTKALLMGFTGGLAGYALGALAGAGRHSEEALSLVDVRLLVLACSTAVVLSLIASWAPAYWAAQQDPADVLRDE
jgi:ABC-type lipoprotein release transport system permease subunit